MREGAPPRMNAKGIHSSVTTTMAPRAATQSQRTWQRVGSLWLGAMASSSKSVERSSEKAKGVTADRNGVRV